MAQARKKLALLIPAHNEELAIAATIRSAIKSGQPARDIYVVNDSSTDATGYLARMLLGDSHVLDVQRGGKAKALQAGLEEFDLTARYKWVHVADADGVFGEDYFKRFRAALNPKYAAYCGYVASLPGGWISLYRSFEYTLAQTFARRIQRATGTVPVIPGPCAVFRSEVLEKLDFSLGTITEDFDLTMQIHRQKLGPIGFVPAAKVHTQDPQNLHDYIKQVQRWHRGFFQVALARRIGFRPQRVDAYLGYTAVSAIVALVQMALIVAAGLVHDHAGLAVFFLWDLQILALEVLVAAAVSRRWDIIEAFPLFYVLRLIGLIIFTVAMVEVVLARRFRLGQMVWDTEGRRYKLADITGRS